ncbi:TIGR02206 family membrane protein [Paenibacillus ginsengarvi]|uniref:TIGR02206 family membrane protein n=1 Tax=Paenibacillus ginsengarvi TaxID=400777 RepID=A0A3B0CIA4_9BACL|nr:TIGR02206 family membrane protein [Paenibacillus ginsengarvi]RKN84922.1 TIGR02206 family membrane protein [Paenibacillus ginsengarvi]
MERFFDPTAPGTFIAFSPQHLIVLSIFALLTVLLYVFRGYLRDTSGRRYVRYVLIAALAASELSLNVWYVAEGVYDPADSLPLELCSISLYLCIFMLLLRSERLFRIAYFTGIGGAVQALLTPVLYYGFPHFVFFEFFAAHIAIILAVLYMVWVERFRPTLRSVFVTLGFLNAMLVLVFIVNSITGGNYMFVARKPETASPLDLLGPYPWYLLSMEAVALVVFLLLYLPFYKRRAVG